jgi:membrane protein YqaA with SNARE-associated domain
MTSREPNPDTSPAPATPPKAVPRWHVHRRMYDWVLSLAHHRHATTALFLLSFAESSFFPIPPDVLQIALTLERRAKAWWFALVSSVASVLGGIAGYLIGAVLWHSVDDFFFNHVPGFTHEHFEVVRQKYEQHAFLAILAAAFTPIPYKVFTITAGVFSVPLWVLIVASALGRAGRFYLVAAMIWKFGEPAKRFVEKYFNLLTLIFMILLVGGLVVIKGVGGGHEAEPADEDVVEKDG